MVLQEASADSELPVLAGPVPLQLRQQLLTSLRCRWAGWHLWLLGEKGSAAPARRRARRAGSGGWGG
ncbi:hypothetical protein ACFXKI_54950, partial [Streptomyces mirabilis]|uniref:hypothetical protein n=1 Tax=Streptomyces mirabilis TaxID=68239 RepID=UPI0036CD6311